MQYHEVTPAPPLRPYIKCMWFLRAAPGHCGQERVLPDGSAEIVLHRGAPMIASGAQSPPRRQPSALIVGQISRCLFLEPSGDIDVVGIRFTPNGLHHLLRASAGELTDRSIELSAWSPGLSRTLMDAVHSSGNCITPLERILLDTMPDRSVAGDAVAVAIGSIVATHGTLPIGEVCQRLNIGGRQLERRFEREVGLGPKMFARIVRFAALVRHAQSNGTPNGARLAQRFGYADQAHFVRDFRHFAGVSPTAYFGDEHPISSLLAGGGDVGFVQAH